MTDRFELDADFISEFIDKQPAWGPVGYVTYKRTYARNLDSIYERHAKLGRSAGLKFTEEFWLTLVRVAEGVFNIQADHCRRLRLPWDWSRAQRKGQEMFRLMWDFKFLPPGRGLWMMGAPVVEKLGGISLNNCAFLSSQNIASDFAYPFCTLMDYSMLGVGVGFDTRGAKTVKIVKPKRAKDFVHVVEDSREGWVEALRLVLDAYAHGGYLPEFDFSQVRAAGMPIRGFGGTSSGPEPLREMLASISALLASRIGKVITSSDIVDINTMIGRCVVSGNVRRSAELALGEPSDDEFLALKDPVKNAKALSSHRWASNNSVFAEVGQSYTKTARLTSKNGEPGYFWLDNARSFGRMIDPPNDHDLDVLGSNPCAEQSLHDSEVCNLVETFPFHHSGAKEYKRTLKFAYLYAKTVTLVPTHNERTNAVMLKNRRIGCSMSGISQAMKRFGRRSFLNMCDEGYAYIQELDREYSGWLCVPRSIKTTSIKPSGTVSLLPGATPGIHHPHSRYYWRVIRFATDSEMLPSLRAAGYQCTLIDPAKEPNTTAVYFPVEEKGFDRGERDVSMWEQLEIAAALQAHWADNQVSVTIKFDRKSEGAQIAGALELYETRLKGVSFLPREDHGYDHAPYQEIDRATYEDAIAKLTPLDLKESVNETQDKYCDGDKCMIPTVLP